MQTGIVFDESEILAGVVIDSATASEEEKLAARQNLMKLSNSMIRNTFTGDYYIVYEAVKAVARYGAILTRSNLEQILGNSLDTIIKTKQINIDDYTDSEDIEEQIQTVMSSVLYTYDKLLEKKVDKEEFSSNLDIYLEQVRNKLYSDVLLNAFKISNEGIFYKGKYLKGNKDANDYYMRECADINKMIVGSGDVGLAIESGKEGFEEYKANKTTLARIPVTDTGLAEIDSIMGPLYTTEVVNILGKPGGAKTRMVVNLVYRALMRGYNVAIWTLEGSPSEYEAMLVAKHIYTMHRVPISDSQLLDGSFPEDMEEVVESARIDLFTNSDYGQFKISPGPLYVETMKETIMNTYDSWRPFHMIAIDYLSLVQSTTGKTRYQIVTEGWITLKQICAYSGKQHGFLGLCPHQLTQETVQALRDGKDADETSGADSAESIRTPDKVFGQYFDKAMAVRRQIEFFFVKGRRSSPFPNFKAFTELGCCAFVSDPSLNNEKDK